MNSIDDANDLNDNENDANDANDSNDNTSDTSISSDSLHEIMGEMDAIILQMDAMHKLHDDAIERLHRVNKRIASHASTIPVQINNCSVDTILDNLYMKALHNIKNTGKNNFSELLLNVLDGQLTDDISMDES